MPHYPETLDILLVEDEESEYLITRALLETTLPTHVQVHWRTNGQEGLDFLLQHPPDLALIDYVLPESNGVSLINHARQKGCKLPLILLTARNTYNTDLEAMSAGADDFIHKHPLDRVLLERMIRYHLQDFQRRRQMLELNLELETQLQEKTRELQASYQAHKKSEQHALILSEIANLANQGADSKQILNAALHAINTHTGWDLGHVSLLAPNPVDPAELELWLGSDYSTYLPLREAESKTVFQNLSTLSQSPAPLPHCFQLSQALHYPRSALAHACGLEYALLCPIYHQNQLLGLMEYFSTQRQPPESESLQLLTEIAQVLGAVLPFKLPHNTSPPPIQTETLESFKHSFLANLSHEIRTPLNAVLGFSQLLLLHPQELNAKQQGYLKQVMEGGQEVLQLFNTALEHHKQQIASPTNMAAAQHEAPEPLLLSEEPGWEDPCLQTLPKEFWQDMQQAFEAADLERVEQLSQSLHSTYPKLAQNLSQWCQDFDYEQLTQFFARLKL